MTRYALCTVVLCFVCGERAARSADGYTSVAGFLTARDNHCDARAGSECRPVGYEFLDVEDEYERYSNGFERFWRGLHERMRQRRLKGYKRVQADHHHFLYPQCPPYCSPTYGHHQTRWRPFPPDCEYSWTTYPGQPVYPMPVAEPDMLMPLTPTPQYESPATPQPAPGAETPYFPESTPAPSNQSPPPPPAEPAQFPTMGVRRTRDSEIEPVSLDLPVIMQIE